jgi:hypothetical protein
MLNSIKKIPVYLATFSTLLLPNAFSQDKKEPELVTIAEIEKGDKTIEYKASQDVADHMKFLTGYAATMIGGYELAKFAVDMGAIPKKKREEITEACQELDKNKNKIIEEEEIINHLSYKKCEINRISKEGMLVTRLLSDGKETYKTSRALEEHFWVAIGKKLYEDKDVDLGSENMPIFGYDDLMKAFAKKADRNGDKVIDTEEYLRLRKEITRKVGFREFTSSISPRFTEMPPYLKKVIEGMWGLMEEGYAAKAIVEIFNSPEKFMDEHLSDEQQKQVKSINLENLEDEAKEAISKVFPRIDLRKATLADKLFIYTMMESRGTSTSHLQDDPLPEKERKTSLFSRNEPYVEKRVIREGPLPLPYQRETVK